jgi:hypothetical protein
MDNTVRSSVQIDTEAWPLVVMRMPRRLDMAAIDDWMYGIDAVLSRRTRFSTIVDTSAMKHLPGAVERRRLVELLNERELEERRYNLGNGVVVASAAARAALTAIHWLRPPAVPQHVAGSFPAALEWCCHRLIAGGVGLTPVIRKGGGPRRALSVPPRSGEPEGAFLG